MVTPLMRQYGLLKESVPGAVLLYRLGDFYEMFYEDAKVANRVLGITLTARAKDDERIPMAGFPHHASLPYVRKLLAAGHRVAVCEQVEDPASARGVVRREVVRVFSPGTLLEDGLLEERRANHLLAIAPERGHLGLAWAELSTGHVLLDEILPEELEDALARIDPSECVLPEAAPEAIVRALGGAFRGVVTRRSSIDFDREGAERRLREQYRVAALDAFGCDGMPHALRAAGALLGYLAETQRGALAHLHAPRRLGREGVMILDRATLRGLEVLASARDGGADGTLLATLDATRTAVGARLLRAWVLRPLTDPSRLVLRHDAVGWFAGDAALRGEIRDLLGKVYDLERIAGRLGTSRANPRDLMGLCESLRSAGAIRDRLGDRAPALVAELARGIPSGGEELASRIAATLVAEPPQTHLEGGVIAPGVDPGIDELRTLLVDGDSWLDRFREEESRRTGIPSLKVVRHRVFGYSIEVTNTHRARVPEGYVRQQTMKNAERYTTSALKTQEERILTARGRLCALESERFEALRAHAAQGVRDIQGVAGAIGALDVLCAFGQAAAERGYVRPEIVQEPVLQVRSGRHPVLDRLLGGSFVPNDMDLRPDRLVQIVTGPNMAGKSTYIRTAGLLVLMAQAGSFV
ncbi:MAG: DNA mismatch repair protein MutS, partial [Planctomycetes bacterium]|nr:DNA mismatch repair protein MutS [Planctomycetota bacterium]